MAEAVKNHLEEEQHTRESAVQQPVDTVGSAAPAAPTVAAAPAVPTAPTVAAAPATPVGPTAAAEAVAKAAVAAAVEAAIADFTGLPSTSTAPAVAATRPLPPAAIAAANAAAEGVLRREAKARRTHGVSETNFFPGSARHDGLFSADVFDQPPFSRRAMDETFGEGGSFYRHLAPSSQFDRAFAQSPNMSSMSKRHS